jgi:hypothetical protein
MRKHSFPAQEACLLAALLAAAALGVVASPPARSAELLLTGQLHARDRSMRDLVLVVEIDGERCQYANITGNGRFSVHVPVGAEARLIFKKPGHLEKEVVIRARNAANPRKADRKNRTIRFDVVLESEQQRPGLQYDGPVGSIAFAKGTGSMQVRHTLGVVAEATVNQPQP